MKIIVVSDLVPDNLYKVAFGKEMIICLQHAKTWGAVRVTGPVFSHKIIICLQHAKTWGAVRVTGPVFSHNNIQRKENQRRHKIYFRSLANHKGCLRLR
jgi:hypothetical protein